MSQGIHLVSNSIPGYILSNEKFQASLGHKLFGRTNVLLKTFPIYHPRVVSIKCKQSNNHRRNPNFSRHQKGSSKGKNRHHHHQENLDETDPLPSKNGSLLSLSSNQRYSSTSTPGRREKVIVELFRKVQAQLRERAVIKEEKKIEASQQGQQGERGTVDSLLKLLRKHSVVHSNKKSGRDEEFNLDESKKSTPEGEFNLDEPERSDLFEEEPNSNFFASTNITTSGEVTFSRPASNFRRRSPVTRVKFQPVFSSSSSKSEWKKSSDNKPKSEHATFEEFEEPDGESSDEHSDSNDSDETSEEKEILGASPTKASDVASLKLSELKDLAKSRGLKGYSKLKKGELVELLSGDCS